MNKKILIISIIATTILIGVSFTSVVGYRSIESGVKISPLFNIRSSRAIDEDNKILTSDYVGKGDDFNLLIPDRDDDTEQLRKAIEIMQAMDNKEIVYELKQLKDNQRIDDVISIWENGQVRSVGVCTVGDGDWVIGCWIYYIINIIIMIIRWTLPSVFLEWCLSTSLCTALQCYA